MSPAKAKTKRKCQHTIEPLGSRGRNNRIVVTNRLTGNFPGTPIELEFAFALENNQITSLEIRS